MSKYSSDSDSSHRKRGSRRRRRLNCGCIKFFTLLVNIHVLVVGCLFYTTAFSCRSCSTSSSESSHCRSSGQVNRSRTSRHHKSSRYKKTKSYSSRSQRRSRSRSRSRSKSGSKSKSRSRRSRSSSKGVRSKRSRSGERHKHSYYQKTKSQNKGNNSNHHSRSTSTDSKNSSTSNTSRASSTHSNKKSMPATLVASSEDQLREKLLKAIKAAESADHLLKQQGVLPKGVKSRNDISNLTPQNTKPNSDIIRDIDSDVFIQKTFTSSKVKKEESENESSNTAAEEPNSALVDENSVFHASFFVDPKTKFDRWVKKLHQIRQRAIAGEPTQ